MTDLLQDKVAIVTGGSRGLGLAVARAFAAEGAKVVIASTTQQGADNAADAISGAIGIQADVRDENSVKNLIDATVERFGALHIMVPNAGVVNPVSLKDMDFAVWRDLMSVSLDGVFLSLHHSIPAIIASGGGSIVMMGSVAGESGTPFMGHYAAAKAAILNLTKTAAIELRDSGVRVNAVVPAFVLTDMVDEAGPILEQLLGMPAGAFGAYITQKQGRFGTPEEVANAAVFLASDKQSGWTTGTGLVLDGGFSATFL